MKAGVRQSESGGEFPGDIEAVEALPGIGRSTAGAILALSRGQRHPILDGNVKRVLARVFGIAGDPGSNAVIAKLWAQAEACTPTTQVGAYTQAIMDLGATLCSRANPACTLCPMSTDCIAALEGRQAELPSPKQKRARGSREATLLIARDRERRRQSQYWWSGARRRDCGAACGRRRSSKANSRRSIGAGAKSANRKNPRST